jgi:hypothetical protein
MKHDFGLCANNAEACRPRLEAFWQQISEHYKDAPANVMFEILNEPNGKITPARIRRGPSLSARRSGTASPLSSSWSCRRMTATSS